MPAIARFDEPYARLLRGFIEHGLPDGTRIRSSDIDFSVEHLLRSTGGIQVRFPAPTASMDDGWTYTVKVLPGPGERVVVRCAETLFRTEWDAAAEPDTAGGILATLVEHNRSFTAWIETGGTVSRVQRVEHQDDPADNLHPDFRKWLAGLYVNGASLNDGPALSWWAGSPGDQRSVGASITAGSGAEPFYRLGPAGAPALDSAHLEHLHRMRSAGTAAWVNAALMTLLGCAGGSWNTVKSYSLGALPTWAIAAMVSMAVAVLWIPLGQALRSPSERWLFRKTPAAAKAVLIALAASGMLPCSGPCCLTGLPIGGWIVYLLLDSRARRLL